MLRNLKGMEGWTVRAMDRDIGTVYAFLFDEEALEFLVATHRLHLQCERSRLERDICKKATIAMGDRGAPVDKHPELP